MDHIGLVIMELVSYVGIKHAFDGISAKPAVNLRFCTGDGHFRQVIGLSRDSAV